MKQFICKGNLFLGCILLFFSVNALVNYFIYTDENFDLNKANVLIMGDSHIHKSVDPSSFFSAVNVAQPAESYVLTYWKLKKMIVDNGVDSVIVGFSPHNLSAFNDQKFSNTTWSEEMFKRCYTILEFKSLDDVKVDWKGFTKVYFKNNCFYPTSDHVFYRGGFEPKEGSHLNKIQTTINRHYYGNGEPFKASVSCIKQLELIVGLCVSNKTKVILVSPPVHPKYYDKIPLSLKKSYKSVKENLQLKGVLVIDKTAEFYPDSLYYDGDHLNSRGANRFSKELAAILRTERENAVSK